MIIIIDSKLDRVHSKHWVRHYKVIFAFTHTHTQRSRSFSLMTLAFHVITGQEQMSVKNPFLQLYNNFNYKCLFLLSSCLKKNFSPSFHQTVVWLENSHSEESLESRKNSPIFWGITGKLRSGGWPIIRQWHECFAVTCAQESIWLKNA